MTRGLLSAPTTWLLIGWQFHRNLQSTLLSALGTYSGPLIPRYPCSQVTRYTEPSSLSHDAPTLRGVGSDWEILASLAQVGRADPTQIYHPHLMRAVPLPQEMTIISLTGCPALPAQAWVSLLTKLRADFICSTNCAASFPLLEAN